MNDVTLSDPGQNRTGGLRFRNQQATTPPSGKEVSRLLGDCRFTADGPTKGPRRKTAREFIAELKALPLADLPEKYPHIYFARAGNGLVKIGFSREVRQRIKNQQSLYPEPFDVVHVARATESPRWIERAMHAHLNDSHHHGEWFRPSAEFLRLLECTKLRAWCGPLPEVRWSSGRDLGPLRVQRALAALARVEARARGAA